MCFIKKAAAMPILPAPEPEKVERHEADASLTKNSQNEQKPKGYLQNIKTSPVGLEDIVTSDKKTLLGE